MTIIADTNVLIRVLRTDDDPAQDDIAWRTVTEADSVTLPSVALCEVAWVLRAGYHTPRQAIATYLRQLLDMPNVVVDGPTIEAGLEILDAGGDFADGVIAYQGRWLGGGEFVSFDKQAVSLLDKAGHRARLLAPVAQ